MMTRKGPLLSLSLSVILLLAIIPSGFSANDTASTTFGSESLTGTRSFDCPIARLTMDERKTIKNSLYAEGFQTRTDIASTPGKATLETNTKLALAKTPEQIAAEFNNKTDPNSEDAKIEENDIGTPDGMRKYDYNAGCVSPDEFFFKSSTDSPYFAAVKGKTTRVSYCDGGASECAPEITANKTLRETANQALDFGKSLVGLDHDTILATNGFEFYEKNGMFSPTTYSTMIYSNVQKVYDNFLPVSFAVSLFIPMPITPTQLKTAGQKVSSLVTDLTNSITKMGKSLVPRTADDIAAAASKALGSGADESIFLSRSIANKMNSFDDAISMGRTSGTIPVNAYDDLLGVLDDGAELAKLKTSALDDVARVLGMSPDEAAKLNSLSVNELRTHLATLADNKGSKAAITNARQLIDSFATVKNAEAIEALQKAELASLVNAGSITKVEAQALLKNSYIKFSDEISDVQKLLSDAAGGGSVGAARKAEFLTLIETKIKTTGLEGRTSAYETAENLYNTYLAQVMAGSGSDDAFKAVSGQLKTYGVTSLDADINLILNGQAGSFTKQAQTLAEEITAGAKEAGQLGYLTAAEEGMFKKMGRMVVGQTTTKKQKVLQGIYELLIVKNAAFTEADRVGSKQTIFKVSPEARSQENIDNYLNGIDPYIDILANRNSYLDGWANLLSFIAIPDFLNNWVSMMQWRFSGDQDVPDVDLNIQCRGDGNVVKDMIWTFRSGKGDEKFVTSAGTIDMSLANGVLLVKTSGSAHSYNTELETDSNCNKDVIVATHGVDIISEIWESNGFSAQAITDFMNQLTGKKTATKTTKQGDGITFEGYINLDPGEERCQMGFSAGDTSLLASAGFGLVAQSLPLVDLITAPYLSYHMSNCIDINYWVHMTVKDDSGGATAVVTDLFSGANVSSLLEGSSAGSGEVSEVSEVTAKTPTGAAISTDLDMSGITLDGSTKEELDPNLVAGTKTTYSGSGKDFLQRIIDGVNGTAEKVQDLMREQDAKRMNKNTFWFRGEYQEGFLGALEVEKLCYIFFAGTSWQLPSSSKISERAMVDNRAPNGKDKTAVMIEDGVKPILKIIKQDANNKTRTILAKEYDPLRMAIDSPRVGTIIPSDASTITVNTESKDILFRSDLSGAGAKAELHSGEYGSSVDVTKVIKCIVEYVNGVLNKQYSEAERDRALAELGEITKIISKEGSQVEKDGEYFVLASPAGIVKGKRIDIRLDKTILLDGIDTNLHVEVLHTEKGQLMWIDGTDTLTVWLYITGSGKATAFGVDEAGTNKLMDNTDSDSDGIPDWIEYLMGLNPFNADSDGDGILDGDEDEDGDGVSNKDEVPYVCDFQGLMLDLGPNLAQYLQTIGPISSFETTGHTVTFIADDSGGTCTKYIRMCDRKSGECADPEEIATIDVAANIISVKTIDKQTKLLEIGLDAEGNPTLKAVHTDENGNVVNDIETFDSEAVEKLRGATGVAAFDPNTGLWTFYNGMDIPRDPSYGDGMTLAPNINNAITGMPGNMMGEPAQSETFANKDSNILAEVPWMPESGGGLFVFIAFLLAAALVIQIKSGGSKDSKTPVKK